ncbi:hypothetical protein B0T10DRAFT_601281 [Thelonectria olida]|uniref:Zinc finger GRF-type domain-containing protein n=1 Tax=Thelonectria olida TaxID=1576542 RepID=A0A9P9AW36_9HYPO|nr:hypothetical protein B0T10DRAFT_601281 [Thelonectria olida]
MDNGGATVNRAKKMVPRETKKEGPNKGRFFYKCFDCRLFIWWEHARIRETGLSSTSRDAEQPAEPTQPKTPSLTQRQLTAYGYQRTSSRRHSDSDEDSSSDDLDEPTAATATNVGLATAAGSETSCPSTTKRKRDVFEDSDSFSDFGSEEEREMIEIADKSAEKLMKSNPNAFVTPSHPRSTDLMGGLPTPSVTRTLFPSAKRQKQVSFEEIPASSSSTPATLGRSTPSMSTASSVTTPSKPPTHPPPSSPLDEATYDVTDEVMALLRTQAIDPKVLNAVQTILVTAARRATGFALGRESAKAAVKARDETVAKLQERIVALENREKMHRSQVTNIKANLMKMYEDN